MGFYCHPKSLDWDLDFWTLDLGLTIYKFNRLLIYSSLKDLAQPNPWEYVELI